VPHADDLVVVPKLDGPSVRGRHVDHAELEGEAQLQPPATIPGTNRSVRV
jgi:hypothetical protein